MWLMLTKKVLMWEALKKRHFHDLGICALCRKDEETNHHIFLRCTYTREVWFEVSRIIGAQYLWLKVIVVEFFGEWFRRTNLKYLLAHSL